MPQFTPPKTYLQIQKGDSITDFILFNLKDPFTATSQQDIRDYFVTKVQEVIDFKKQRIALTDNRRSPKLTPYEIAVIVSSMFYIKNLTPIEQNEADNTNKELIVYQYCGPKAGLYRPGQHYILDYVADCLTMQGDGSTKQFNDVMAILQKNVPNVTLTEDPNRVIVNNGIFDLTKHELEPFNPDYIAMAKIATDYNPTATIAPVLTSQDGSTWTLDDWLNSFGFDSNHQFDADIPKLLWQILQNAVNPFRTYQKCILLASPFGNNGKGTFGELIKSLVGFGNFTALSVDEFDHEFKAAGLIGSKLNIADENNVDMYIEKVKNFKASITGDTITVNRKHKTPLTIRPRLLNIQMFNGYPKLKDKSPSVLRRLLIVPFTISFTNNGQNYDIKDKFVKDQDVLEYALNRILNMPFPDTYIEPKVSQQALNEFRAETNPVVEFWMEFEDQFTWDLVPNAFLYELFKAWFKENNPNGTLINRKTFVNLLQQYLETENTKFSISTNIRQTVGTAMDKDEPLITQYRLTNYMDATYNGVDLKTKRQFKRPIRIRGCVIRK